MIRAALIWLCLALPVSAQELPDWTATTINDFAGLLTNADKQTIDQALIALQGETGSQGTVVTLTDRARYGGTDGLEAFTTRLFNDWGVGEAGRNDGFMLLVIRDDREARVELGAGYPGAADLAAQAIIENTLLPAIRAGEISGGIRDGTLAIIADIARPHAAGMGFDGPVDKPDLMDWLSRVVFFGVFGLIGFNILRKTWQRFQLGRQPCPNCGGAGLVQESEVIQPTDGTGRASQVIWTRCRRCNWTSPRSEGRPISRRSSSGGRGGGFGGGRSSGGGASGRW
ncbi:YgcG family protein [uncultured Paracoccus sp.]|uniref:TPM domain-containing protein n=1 Tax=uncultured Paracoccus sp. TaxID=189685 RepID=UPI002603F956|nr:TPM domain-containing protein [uncultured Paracoccus sp.]